MIEIRFTSIAMHNAYWKKALLKELKKNRMSNNKEK